MGSVLTESHSTFCEGGERERKDEKGTREEESASPSFFSCFDLSFRLHPASCSLKMTLKTMPT